MKPKRIGLYPNLKRDEGLPSTRKVIELLSAYGIEFLAPETVEEKLSDLKDKVKFLSEDEVISAPDCLVTLGGDGTILSVARRAAEADTPIFGVNLGHVGFMAALEKKELSRITALAEGHFTESSRMMLSCFINGKEELLALNELVIAPEKGFHIVELDLLANKKPLCTFRADGVIFNTPTGSTGYSFSAGGAVMDGEFDAVGVKAISSYLLMGAHHMIFSPETVFEAKGIRVEDTLPTVCADGRETRTLSETDAVEIRRSEKRVRLITPEEKTNHEVFFRKF